MSSQFANLNISRIVIHEVFARGSNKEVVAPRFGQGLTELDREGLTTLADRIINALGDDSHSIEMIIEKDDDSSAFRIATELLGSPTNEFVNQSERLATKLADSQTSRNIPGGVVVVFDGTIGADGNRFVGIIKAEVHGGFSKLQSSGKLLLQYLSDLLLTPQQKLYKIGILIEKQTASSEGPRSPSEFATYVYDHNMTRTETQQAALYFFGTFLGCCMSPTAKKLTSDFYYHTREFVRAMKVSDERLVDLNSALYTYLKLSQKATIRMVEFADDYLPQKVRDKYIKFMAEKKFPRTAIQKDLTYLRNKLRKRRVRFTSKASITAPADEFDSVVQFDGMDGTKTVVKIEGTIAGED